MDSCRHPNLILLQEKNKVLRCRHCHLTIDADELGDGYCPECYEERGVRHHDFDEVEAPDGEKVRYRCEDCGALIEIE